MFELRLHATADAIDELGHVNNVRYVQWVQDVALAHSAHVGLDFAAYRALGAVFVLRRHTIDYLSSVQEGSELLARTWIEETRSVQVERRVTLHQGERKVMDSLTLWVFVDFARGRPVRIPESVRAAFGVDASHAKKPRTGAGEP
jgi:acyl-CoA thioester hydrolase